MALLLAQQNNALPGLDGFLGTRGSFMVDVVVLAMVAVLPVLAVSIYLVKIRKRYSLHKRIQIILGTVLLVTVLAFEIDIQFVSMWEVRAERSPHFDMENKWTCLAGISLIVHLCFAVPTLLLWVFTIIQALRHFPKPPLPNEYSSKHKLWGRLSAIGMLLTAVTGWTFYLLAFAIERKVGG